MIISPPFLPSQPGHEMDSADAGNTTVPDHDVCAAGMQECAPGNGAYPVSYNLGWHGGLHLVAPKDEHCNAVPVRTIADGTVVYAPQTKSREKDTLSYRGVRTGDGWVVVKRLTEIGDGDESQVTFFSAYMHLQSVSVTMVRTKICRNDVPCVPGQINGRLRQTHFEFVCDTVIVKSLMGDKVWSCPS